MLRKERKVFYRFIFLLGLFLLGILFNSQQVSAADWPTNESESDILGGHVHAKLMFEKDNSQEYTAVGDTVTVTTELTKLDDIPLDESYDQSSMVILYPNVEQGLELIGQPTYMIKNGNATNTGEFVPDEKILTQNVIDIGFNMYADLYKDPFHYTGVMTPIKVKETDDLDDFNQDPRYSDTFSLKNILVNKGTVVTLSYQVRVTQKAVDVNVGKLFSFHSVIYDSSLNGTGDYDLTNGFLTAEMPGIQAMGVAFDQQSKNQLLDVKDAKAVHLSGTWHDDPTAKVTQTLTANGKDFQVPQNSFKDDGTFDMTVDLSSIVTKAAEVPVTIKLEDDHGQSASDTATLNFQQTNVAPEVQLGAPAEGEVVNSYSSTREIPIQLKWKDDDSEQVTLSYILDNGSEIILAKDLANPTPGEWQTYDGKINWAEALAIGMHHAAFDVEDSDGAKASKTTEFSINVQPDILGFKTVGQEMIFPEMYISNRLLQSSPETGENVVITDTLNDPNLWRLTVKQTSDFTSGAKTLKGAELSFVSETQTASITNNPDGIILPVEQATTNDYSLIQNEKNHFQLNIPSGNLTGNYSADLEWTIVAAP